MGVLAAREQASVAPCCPDTHCKTALCSPPNALAIVAAQQYHCRALTAQTPELQRTATMRRVAIALLAFVGAAEAFVAPQPTAAPLTVVAGRADLCSNHE